MALKLMFITNQTEIALTAEAAGVDRIWVDLEYIGKAERQGGMDTVQSHHTIENVGEIRRAITKAEVMVRVNPIHEASAEYGSSKEEIDAVIDAGADIIMLPYFKTVEEVQTFIELVKGRAKVFPLLETPEAVRLVDKILELEGIDEIFIGLNDLSREYKQKCMFKPLADGTVERLCKKFEKAGLPYGFGGIACLDDEKVAVRAENVLIEHYRLKSSRVILSRHFFDLRDKELVAQKETIFPERVQKIRTLEKECERCMQEENEAYFRENQKKVWRQVKNQMGNTQGEGV